jgi:molybdopterin converting factor small subunit
MITVKFFGVIRIHANVRQLCVTEGTVRQILDEVRQRCPEISEQLLQQAMLFVNKQQISGKKRFSTILKEGDELALLSPSGESL